jgi:hypothetical protein
MVGLWSWLTGAWLKEGCGIDPWGLCKAEAPPLESVDAECLVDLWGRCTALIDPQPTTEAGCGIDPWGQCK